MRTKILTVLALIASATSQAQSRSAFGVSAGFGGFNNGYNSGSAFNVGLSYGSGNGYMGAPMMPINSGGFNSLYGMGQFCGYYGGGMNGGVGGGYPGLVPIAPPVARPPMAGTRPPVMPGPRPPVGGIPGMGPGPVGPMPTPYPPIARPMPMPYPMPYPPMGPCIPCGGAIAGGGGGGFYAPPPAMYGYNGGGFGAYGGVNINVGGATLGGNGQLIAALGMGLSAQTTNVYPVQPQRFTITQIQPQPYPVFYGGTRDPNLNPRAGGHNPF